jgi:hypothetical protein
MLSLVPLVLSALLAAPAVAPLTERALLESSTRHIRSTDAAMRALLKRGFRRSVAFATLLHRIQRSDLIVYVEEVPRLPGGLQGRLMIQPSTSGQQRYARIQIALHGPIDEAVALLGHELQHAVEVADAPEVRDQNGLIALYERIGTRGGAHLYDTAAAQDMGRTVRRQLAS